MYFEVNNKSVTGVTSVIDGADLNIACSGFAEVRSIDGPSNDNNQHILSSKYDRYIQ